MNSVDIVRIKQAQGFETTYFTILEKLKEPHYSRIVFGIPAVLFILFAISYYFNFGWQLPVALIGCTYSKGIRTGGGAGKLIQGAWL